MPFLLFYPQNKRKKITSKTIAFMATAFLLTNFLFPCPFSQAKTAPIEQSSLLYRSSPSPLFLSHKTKPKTINTIHLNKANLIPPTPKPKIKYSFYVLVTAYSSTVSQCDSTPFITANGTRVHDGIVATNFLPFGTKLRFLDYSGKKVYTVEDRMHPRFRKRIDIWMPTTKAAKEFGVKWLKVEVLE